LADIEAAVNDLSAKLAAAAMGGRADTAAKNNSREVLIASLRRLAVYVQLNCGNSVSTLLSSGFEAASTNRSQSQLDAPEGLTVRIGSSGQLIASVKRVRNRALYEGRIKPEEGDWLPSAFSRDSRRISFDGLTPGAMYIIQVRALGGATGKSEWTDQVFHRSL
jgi:hypothetical protein